MPGKYVARVAPTLQSCGSTSIDTRGSNQERVSQAGAARGRPRVPARGAVTTPRGGAEGGVTLRTEGAAPVENVTKGHQASIVRGAIQAVLGRVCVLHAAGSNEQVTTRVEGSARGVGCKAGTGERRRWGRQWGRRRRELDVLVPWNYQSAGVWLIGGWIEAAGGASEELPRRESATTPTTVGGKDVWALGKVVGAEAEAYRTCMGSRYWVSSRRLGAGSRRLGRHASPHACSIPLRRTHQIEGRHGIHPARPASRHAPLRRLDCWHISRRRV